MKEKDLVPSSPINTPAVTPVTESLSQDSPLSSLSIATKIISSNDPMLYIEKAGVDLVLLYKNLYRIAVGAKLVAKDRDGDPIELGEDNKAQISASALLLELAKHIKDKSVVTNVGIFNDPSIVDDAKRVLAMRDNV